VVLVFCVSVWLLYALAQRIYMLFFYFGIAAALSVMGRPVVDFLVGRRLGRLTVPPWLAALLTVLGFYAILLGVTASLIPLVVKQAGALSGLDPAQVVRSLDEPILRLEQQLAEFGVPPGQLQQSAEEAYDSLIGAIAFGDVFSNTIGLIGNIALMVFVLTFSTFFLLKERTLFRRIILTATPDDQVERVKRVLKSTRYLLTRYLVGLLGQLTVYTIVVSAGLSILGIPYAILIAVLAGFLNVIPYLGPLLGGTMGVLLAVSSYPDYDFYAQLLPLAAKVVAVFWAAQIIDNNLVVPTIFSKVVKAHPLEIFFVVIAAGKLAGVGGMILAIPAYTVLRIIAREFFSEFKVVKALTERMGEEPGRPRRF
jgi:predicted PurR-regulated permease PerM